MNKKIVEVYRLENDLEILDRKGMHDVTTNLKKGSLAFRYSEYSSSKPRQYSDPEEEIQMSQYHFSVLFTDINLDPDDVYKNPYWVKVSIFEDSYYIVTKPFFKLLEDGKIEKGTILQKTNCEDLYGYRQSLFYNMHENNFVKISSFLVNADEGLKEIDKASVFLGDYELDDEEKEDVPKPFHEFLYFDGSDVEEEQEEEVLKKYTFNLFGWRISFEKLA